MKEQRDKYNQVIANWYGVRLDYITLHANCEKGMIEHGKISMMTFYQNEHLEDNDYRYITIFSKKNYNN
jgi:hypothetical protein